MTKKIRVGIIGTGFGASVQAPGFAMHPDCEVVALSGVTRPGRAREQADKLSIPRAYDDYQTMFAQEELDLVSIASAPHLHRPMALAALERGIPVLCEKPMALNLAEAMEMVRAAEDKGIVNAIDFEFRHLPARTHFKQLIDDGFLGELHHFTCTYSMGAYERNLARPMGWIWDEAIGGGMLGALGSHLIDSLRWFFGDIKRVAGSLTVHVEERVGGRATADDTFSFLARMGPKSTGAVQFLMHAHHGFGMRIEAFGSKGTLVLADTTVLAARAGEEMAEVPLPERYDVPGVVYAPELDRHIPAFMVMVDNLVTAIRAPGAPGPSRQFATFRDGAAVQAVLDAIRRSHKEGRWVDVESVE